MLRAADLNLVPHLISRRMPRLIFGAAANDGSHQSQRTSVG